MRDVAIIGVGQTKYGERWDMSLRKLAVEAGLKAIEDAGIYAKDIEAIYGGNMSSSAVSLQEHVGALISDYSGLAEMNIPAIRVESASASGAAAMHEGFLAVASGMYDTVLVGGVEKMTDIDADEMTDSLMGAADREWEGFVGATFPSLAAMMARRYMHDYKLKREQMAIFPVNSHRNASLNPYAHLRNIIKIDDVLNATMVSEPLTLMDCAPITDGASAVILTALDKVKSDSVIKVSASAHASDYLSLHSRPSITTFNATVEASKKAYKMAKKEPKDISLVEVHDAFSIFGVMSIEDLGFVKKGTAGKFLEEEQIGFDGKLPINTSGGLKAKGHPVGATGVGQIVEAVTQLLKKADKRQVKDPKVALTNNIGGTGASSFVHILEVVK